jgi:hypothetical protein
MKLGLLQRKAFNWALCSIVDDLELFGFKSSYQLPILIVYQDINQHQIRINPDTFLVILSIKCC